MRGMILCSILVLACACRKEPAEPKDFLERIEQDNLGDAELALLMSHFPGMTPACIEKVRVRGVEAMPRRTEDCYVMTPKKRWTGLWRATFEGSEFCADEPQKRAQKCGGAEHSTWFYPKGKYELDGALYRVEFVGRRTAVPGHHGHFGGFEHSMVVDDMISVKQVEAPPSMPTKAAVIKQWKECEARGDCIPFWDEINKIEE